MLAVRQEVYYLDNAALRLYSAAEHLADAISCMLEVTPQGLAAYRNRGRSNWARIAAFVENQRQDLRFAGAVAALQKDPPWKLAIRYRGAWVHNQPPTVAGLGIVYRRKQRWERGSDSWSLVVGKGDSPEFTVEQLGKSFVAAAFHFADVFGGVVGYYIELINANRSFRVLRGRGSSPR